MQGTSGKLSPPLPARYYIEPDAFEIDKQAIFYRTWQCVGHASQVRKAGDYLSFSVVDEDIAVVRGQDSKLRAFYNVCRHRGHPVVEGAGNCTSIVCPYHGWIYDLNGQLSGAREARGQADINPKTIRLRRVRARGILRVDVCESR